MINGAKNFYLTSTAGCEATFILQDGLFVYVGDHPTVRHERQLVDFAMIDVPICLSLFTRAGRYPDRRNVVPPSIPLGHQAAEILAEFGGLCVRPGTAG